MKFLRQFRRWLAGKSSFGGLSPFKDLNRAFENRSLLLQVFYIFNLFVAVATCDAWNSHLNGPDLIPLWPLGWTSHVSKNAGLYFILGLQLTTAFLGAFFHGSRTIRLLVFLGLLEYVSLRNSYGKIGHSFHLLLLISFLLIFLPKHWNNPLRAGRQIRATTLLIFTSCQFLILLSYSLAGFGKVLLAFYQMAAGEIHTFHPKALPLHISQRLLESNARSALGPWMIEHHLLIWPMMLVTLYLQFFAIAVLFRPSLHRPWIAGLILFHIFSYLTLTINFPYNCFLLAFFFLAPPPPLSSLRQMLADLPLFGMVFRQMFSKQA